jgi:Rhodopirellula transposase DDE domain
MAIAADVESVLRAKFEAVLPHLDERAARLVLAGEARSLGHGGMAAVARASGASRSRIQDGVAELESGAPPLERIRRAGGGRKPAEQADPGLLPALVALVEPTRRGDPESALSWTTLSVRKLAAELTTAGHRVTGETVGKLLRANGFSLQGNAKRVEGGGHRDRDAQFSYLNGQVSEHQQAGEPVISVDTKKKELVGNYKNGGREWRPAGRPEPVKVHDFIDPARGKAKGQGRGISRMGRGGRLLHRRPHPGVCGVPRPPVRRPRQPARQRPAAHPSAATSASPLVLRPMRRSSRWPTTATASRPTSCRMSSNGSTEATRHARGQLRIWHRPPHQQGDHRRPRRHNHGLQ